MAEYAVYLACSLPYDIHQLVVIIVLLTPPFPRTYSRQEPQSTIQCTCPQCMTESSTNEGCDPCPRQPALLHGFAKLLSGSYPCCSCHAQGLQDSYQDKFHAVNPAKWLAHRPNRFSRKQQEMKKLPNSTGDRLAQSSRFFSPTSPSVMQPKRVQNGPTVDHLWKSFPRRWRL